MISNLQLKSIWIHVIRRKCDLLAHPIFFTCFFVVSLNACLLCCYEYKKNVSCKQTSFTFELEYNFAFFVLFCVSYRHKFHLYQRFNEKRTPGMLTLICKLFEQLYAQLASYWNARWCERIWEFSFYLQQQRHVDEMYLHLHWMCALDDANIYIYIYPSDFQCIWLNNAYTWPNANRLINDVQSFF